MFDALPTVDPVAAGLRPEALRRLEDFVAGHIAEGRYKAAQLAIARHGALAFSRAFGEAAPGRPAVEDTLFLLYSNTKVLTAAMLWVLAERGELAFSDRVSDFLPDFARFGKKDVTLLQLMTHQGGFPSFDGAIDVPVEAYRDRAILRDYVNNLTLQWEPGSRVHYHGLSAHWVAAMVVEAITGQDFRDFAREVVFEPLGLEAELSMGVPDALAARAAWLYSVAPDGTQVEAADNNADRRRAGVPGGGGYGSARAMASFYQALLNGGALGGRRLIGPQTLKFALRDHTGDRISNSGIAMHFGIGVYTRGTGFPASDIGPTLSPSGFGHGGAGSSICWGDPETGVSFAYVTNTRIDTPWHERRMALIGQIVQSAIV